MLRIGEDGTEIRVNEGMLMADEVVEGPWRGQDDKTVGLEVIRVVGRQLVFELPQYVVTMVEVTKVVEPMSVLLWLVAGGEPTKLPRPMLPRPVGILSVAEGGAIGPLRRPEEASVEVGTLATGIVSTGRILSWTFAQLAMS